MQQRPGAGCTRRIWAQACQRDQACRRHRRRRSASGINIGGANLGGACVVDGITPPSRPPTSRYLASRVDPMPAHPPRLLCDRLHRIERSVDEPWLPGYCAARPRLRGRSCQRATASNRRSRGKECCGSRGGGKRGGASSEGTTGAGASRPAGRFAPALSPGPGAVCQVVQLDPAHRHTRGADSDNWLTAGSAGNGSYSYYMAQRVQAAAS